MKWFPNKQRRFELAVQLIYFVKSWLHGRHLISKQDNTSKIQKGDILLFCTLRNEAIRIPFFLEYYRKLGIRHFLFVDNGSTDNFSDIVSNEDDISVWYTERSYKKSNFGMHWLNFLLRKYGSTHWCLTCDPDELLVYPYCDQRNLYELAEFLESEYRLSLFCLMLDMYPKVNISDAKYHEGQDPLEVAPYFDADLLDQRSSYSREVWIRGGVRQRVFFKKCPELSPALNKIPFIKWRWSYSYVSSMHCAVPFFLNEPHSRSHLSPTGTILHFKFLATMKEKVNEEMSRKQHFDDGIEYKSYQSHLSKNTNNLLFEKSEKFTGWNQLIELGLMNIGQWF